jgi:6-hydroxycyclohex-1-ene-1-carbonyl-CoA dehydrogenase
MADIPDKIQTWQMVQPTSKDRETGEITPGKLEKKEIPVPELGPGDVLVEIGVCHTDLGFFYDGVPNVNTPPLTLGHEIAGTVVAGDEKWIGKEVIIPAVMPCRKCLLCKTGRGNRCLNQKMPGNSLGIYVCFAKQVAVIDVLIRKCPVTVSVFMAVFRVIFLYQVLIFVKLKTDTIFRYLILPLSQMQLPLHIRLPRERTYSQAIMW